jgi:hypothetical protein
VEIGALRAKARRVTDASRAGAGALTVQARAPAARAAGEDVRVVEEPIEQRGDGGGVAEQLAPAQPRPDAKLPQRRRRAKTGGRDFRKGENSHDGVDTESGQHLLVPHGARLIGLYDHQVDYGQERVLVSWTRVLFPNGASLSFKDGMPGTDAAGAAGFADQVNHHLVRVFGNALLLSIISAGVQLSQFPDFGRGFAGPSAGSVLGTAVGQQLGQTTGELIRRGIDVARTLEIRPGYAFNVMVTQDLEFTGPYDNRVRP